MGDTAGKTAETVMRTLPLFEGIGFVPDMSKVLNSSKVSDHTAIIPTLSLANTNLDEVPNGEKNILFLIACRLLCAVSAPYIYDTVTAEIGCNGFSFTAKGRTVISEGFKAIENALRQKQKCKDESEDILSFVRSPRSIPSSIIALAALSLTEPLIFRNSPLANICMPRFSSPKLFSSNRGVFPTALKISKRGSPSLSDNSYLINMYVLYHLSTAFVNRFHI